MIKRLLASLAVFAATLAPAGVAFANPSYFGNGTSTAAATTTLRYMTPGTGTTTTPIFDTYEQTTNGGVTSKTDLAGLLVNFAASGTPSVLGINVEYSQNGIDWYRNYLVDPNQIGTSTTNAAFSVNSPFAMSWKFASSTLGGISAASSSNMATAAFVIPTPFRYTRVWFAMTGGNGAVYAQLVPIKERQ